MDSASPLPLICVIAPCFNEESVIGQFHTALASVLDEMHDVRGSILLVDDGSDDGTLEKLNAIAAADPRVRVMSLSRNFGHQVALTAGLDAADADAVILLDSDLQHPPSLIPDMVRLWRQGYDVVSAIREQTDGAAGTKKVTSRLFYTLFNLLSDTKLTPGAADFCLLSRRACTALRSMPEKHRLLRGMVSWMGFRRAYLPYVAPARAAGGSKYSAAKMISLAIDAVLSFSTAPIRLAFRLGLLTVLASAAYLAYILWHALVRGDTVRGWGSIVCLILLLNGVQLIFVGLIGEYLGRVYEQSKGRPLYFLKHDTGAPVQNRAETP